MKAKLIILGMIGTIMTLQGCSGNDDAESPVDKNVISFGAVVPNGSRGASTSTATIKDFIVYAFTGGSTLIDGVKVTRNGGIWTYSPEAYWPVTPVNFFAYSPDVLTAANFTESGGGSIPGYLNDGKVDLLYSVHKDVVQQAAPVSLNFRHALSKVSVMLSSKNPRIKVTVSYISVKNLYREGNFTFPQSSTLASAPEAVGSWSNLKSLSDLMTFAIIDEADRVDLTPQPTDYTLTTLDCSYVIPQPLNEVQLSASGYSGNYIEVDCQIYDTATGAVLWPNSHTPDYMLVPHSETGRIVFPATSDLVKAYLPGHAYVYNIEINNPEVLDKIEFDVTVDEFSVDEM